MAASPLILSRLKCFSSVTGNRHRVPTWFCKLLLPKFNTWKPVQIERKKGSLQLFDSKRIRDASRYTSKKNIAQAFILERYFFVSICPAAIPGTCLAVFLAAVLLLC